MQYLICTSCGNSKDDNEPQCSVCGDMRSPCTCKNDDSDLCSTCIYKAGLYGMNISYMGVVCYVCESMIDGIHYNEYMCSSCRTSAQVWQCMTCTDMHKNGEYTSCDRCLDRIERMSQAVWAEALQ